MYRNRITVFMHKTISIKLFRYQVHIHKGITSSCNEYDNNDIHLFTDDLLNYVFLFLLCFRRRFVCRFLSTGVSEIFRLPCGLEVPYRPGFHNEHQEPSDVEVLCKANVSCKQAHPNTPVVSKNLGVFLEPDVWLSFLNRDFPHPWHHKTISVCQSFDG